MKKVLGVVKRVVNDEGGGVVKCWDREEVGEGKMIKGEKNVG